MRGMTPEFSQTLDLLRSRLYDLLESGPATPAATVERDWSPPTDLRVTPQEVVLTMELCGVPREAVEVTLRGSTLTVAGVRHRPSAAETLRFHQAERPTGRFSRSFSVPWPLAEDSTSAQLEEGMLTVHARRLADAGEGEA